MIDNTLYDAFGQRQVSTIYKAQNQYHVVMEVEPQVLAIARHAARHLRQHLRRIGNRLRNNERRDRYSHDEIQLNDDKRLRHRHKLGPQRFAQFHFQCRQGIGVGRRGGFDQQGSHGPAGGVLALQAASGTMASLLVETAAPADADPLPTLEMELSEALRAELVAMAEALVVVELDFVVTVPITAFVVSEPVADPPEVLT